jgi:hypothetical protein
VGKKKAGGMLDAAQHFATNTLALGSMSFDNQILFLTAKTTEPAIALARQFYVMQKLLT